MFLLEKMKISILFDCKKSLALSYVLYSVSIREQTEPKQCIYKGWIRDKAPPVSAVIDIHREL